MKLVAIDYTYTVVCSKKVEVPDDFTFESADVSRPKIRTG